MAQPARFTFDTVFEKRPDGTAALPQIYRAADLEAARAAAYAEGYAAGRSDALVRAEQECAALLGSLADSIGAALGGLEQERVRLTAEAADLARLLAGKLAPALLKAHPAAEIEAILGEALSHLSDAPRVVVSISEDTLECVRPRVEAVARARGLADRVVIVGEPDLRDSDCRIEWAEGGINRDLAAVEREIEAMIERHVGRSLRQAAPWKEAGNG